MSLWERIKQKAELAAAELVEQTAPATGEVNTAQPSLPAPSSTPQAPAPTAAPRASVRVVAGAGASFPATAEVDDHDDTVLVDLFEEEPAAPAPAIEPDSAAEEPAGAEAIDAPQEIVSDDWDSPTDEEGGEIGEWGGLDPKEEGVDGQEPCTMERWVEITKAQSAAAERGSDASRVLELFGLTQAEWDAIDGWWSQHFTANAKALMPEYNRLQQKYDEKYVGGAATDPP